MGSSILKSEACRKLLAKNVRAMLTTLQWSENELARRSGVSQKQVNNICMARTGCGVDAMAAIAHAMAIDAWQLLVPGFHAHTDIASRTARLMNAYLAAANHGRASFDAVLKEQSPRK